MIFRLRNEGVFEKNRDKFFSFTYLDFFWLNIIYNSLEKEKIEITLLFHCFLTEEPG